MTRSSGETPEHDEVRGAVARRPDLVLAAARDFWQLPDDELDLLLTLSQSADRVELKLAVPESAQDATCAALGVDFARAPAYRVYYLDTEDRALYRHGVIARVRSVHRRPGDSVIKLRPVSPDGIGPVHAHRSKLVPDGFDRPLLVEQWTFPNGPRLLELSTRCRPEATLRVAAQMAAVQRACGVYFPGPQQTKTCATLDFFSTRRIRPASDR